MPTCGKRCSGLTAASRSAYEIRNAWMAEGYDWHGLPARLGKATLLDALDDIHAAPRSRQGTGQEGHPAQDPRRRRGTPPPLRPVEAQPLGTRIPSLHRQMRKQWQGGTSHCTNQIVADAGSYTTKVWHGRVWVYLQGMERGQRIAIPLRGTHLPTGTLRIILQDDGQVARSLRHRRDRRMQHEALRHGDHRRRQGLH